MHVSSLALSDVGLSHLDDIPIDQWRVSKTHVFGEDKWILDGTGEVSHRTLIWDTPLRLVGGSLMDPGREELLFATKLAFFLMVQGPLGGNAAGTLKSRFQTFKLLAGFMLRDHLPDFSYLTSQRLWGISDPLEENTFLTFMLEAKGGDPKEITAQTVRVEISNLSSFFDVSEDLKRFGIDGFPENPFAYHEINKLAKLIGKKPSEPIRPVPDEVAIPLLNKAYEWIGPKAEDVIQLTKLNYDMFRTAVLDDGLSEQGAIERQKAALENFEFSCLDGNDPWHPKLYESYEYIEPNTGYVKQKNGAINGGFERLRGLQDTVAAAAAIIIQQSSGMRVNEVVSLRSGWREDGTPACLEDRIVASGATVVTVLIGSISKVNDGVPEYHEWIVGAAPNLGPHIPKPEIPVRRAVDVLLRLTDPLRQFPDTPEDVASALFLTPVVGLARSGENVTKLAGSTINKRYKSFLATELSDVLAALPDDSPKLVQDGWLGKWRETNGDIISSHMLRKLFANFAYSSDPTLLEAIRDQYGHVNVAMTMGYAKNKQQIRELNGMEAEMAVQSIIQIMSSSSLAGRGADEIETSDEWTELKTEFMDASTKEKPDVVKRWMLRTGRLMEASLQDIEDGKTITRHVSKSAISNDAHALCASISTSAQNMQCRIAGNTTHWMNDGLGPDKSHRTLSACLGCINGIITSNMHGPYWRNNYVRNLQQVEANKLREEPISKVQHYNANARQARLVLKRVEVTVEEFKELEQEAFDRAKASLEVA